MTSQDPSDSVQKKNVNVSINAALAVSTQVNALLKMPDIDNIPQIPDLPKYQTAAKTHAGTWEPIYKDIIQTATDIIGYGDMFTSTYNRLNALLDSFDSGTPEEQEQAKQTFIQVLNEGLLPELKSRQDSASEVSTKTKTFADAFDQDATDFASALQQAMDLYSKDVDVEIPRLQAEITALRIKAKDILFGIIGSESARITGTAAILYFQPELAGPLIIGLNIATTIADFAILGAYLATTNEMLDKVDKLHEIQAQAQQLSVVDHAISGYKDAVTTISDQADAVHKGWVTLVAEMTTMIGDAEKLDPEKVMSILLGIRMDTMNKEWTQIVELAQKLLPTGEIPVTEYNSAADYEKDQQQPSTSTAN